jgi:phospholipid transport system substrate-binding protein
MLALAAGGVGLVLDMSLGLGFEVMMPRPAPASDTAAAAEASPMGVVRALVEQALAILRDGSAPTAERQQQLRELIAPVFDFTTMSRFALGYHWRDLTPEQRREFTDVFARFVQDSYLSRINEYSGQDVTFGKVMSESADYAQVHTRIVERGKPPTAVNYRLERVDGVWRIYDVTVDNLSILANYRNQFSRVMNKQGYAALVSDLRKKQRHLGSSLGEARAE